MSNQYDKLPGKGFENIPGYEPPAGTYAAKEKRRKDDEKRRESEESFKNWQSLGKERLARIEAAEMKRKAQERKRQKQVSKRGPKPEKKTNSGPGWGLILLIIIFAIIAGNREKGNTGDKQKPGTNHPTVKRTNTLNHPTASFRPSEGQAFKSGVFLYEEKVENYWNDWWGRIITTSANGKRPDYIEIAIRGEGKTVDFEGVLKIKSSDGSCNWSRAMDFETSISEQEAKSIVPKRVVRNAIQFFVPK